MNYSNIPDELKALNQWACYKTYFNKKENKTKKVIISSVNGEFAKSNEAATWDSYENAKNYCQKHKYLGLVFVLVKDIVFVDLDHAVDVNTGQIISKEALSLLEQLHDTFSEKSVSGSGIHILFKGNLPENALKRNDKKGIEMYDTKRFICLTGNLIGNSTALKDYSSIAAQINYNFVGKRKQQIARAFTSSSQSDLGLINLISNSRQGVKFKKLFSGNTNDYESHSGADFALASILAWWTQDFGQIERIFRSSGLMRDKFDRRTGNSTYGLNLITAAINSQTSHKTHGSDCQM